MNLSGVQWVVDVRGQTNVGPHLSDLMDDEQKRSPLLFWTLSGPRCCTIAIFRLSGSGELVFFFKEAKMVPLQIFTYILLIFATFSPWIFIVTKHWKRLRLRSCSMLRSSRFRAGVCYVTRPAKRNSGPRCREPMGPLEGLKSDDNLFCSSASVIPSMGPHLTPAQTLT